MDFIRQTMDQSWKKNRFLPLNENIITPKNQNFKGNQTKRQKFWLKQFEISSLHIGEIIFFQKYEIYLQRMKNMTKISLTYDK